jgi:hypothetical protein
MPLPHREHPRDSKGRRRTARCCGTGQNKQPAKRACRCNNSFGDEFAHHLKLTDVVQLFAGSRKGFTAETALVGWGARIRTWEWRNQNPQEAFDMLRKRPLICKGFPVSCCICVALGKECATCLPQSSV